MFGKLLKHEFKATGRTLLPLYGGFVALVLAASGMLWLAWRFGEVHVNGSTAIVQGNTIFGILSMLAIVIVTEVLIIMRFYRLLGDDGYFWFSLPVTPAQHMMVKLIAAMVWSFASVALFVGGIFAFVLVANSMENGAVLAELWAALRFTTTLGPVFGVLGLFVLASLLTMAAGCLQVQLACALGMQWPQSRLGASIGMYVLLSVFLVASGPHITTLPAMEVPRVLMTAMGGFCLLCFILCAVYFAVTRWLLTKRLNLA